MVINNFNIVGVAVLKAKANPPLLVDADAPLSLAVSCEGFKAVSWRHAQGFDTGGGVEPSELVPRGPHPLTTKLADIQPLEEGGGLFVGERFNHALIITNYVNNVKRYSTEYLRVIHAGKSADDDDVLMVCPKTAAGWGWRSRLWCRMCKGHPHCLAEFLLSPQMLAPMETEHV